MRVTSAVKPSAWRASGVRPSQRTLAQSPSAAVEVLPIASGFAAYLDAFMRHITHYFASAAHLHPVADLPDTLVYAGNTMGVMPAHQLLQQRELRRVGDDADVNRAHR
mgnify:CR=1 FL=1